MTTLGFAPAARWVAALAAGAALTGCATYGPAYPAYGPAPVATAYPATTYYDYSYDYPYYGYGYGYGGPAYFGPSVSLNFDYRDHGYRGGHGYRGYRGYPNRGHAWAGPRPGGPRPGGGHFGGPRGGGAHFGGPRGGGFGGGGHGHR